MNILESSSYVIAKISIPLYVFLNEGSKAYEKNRYWGWKLNVPA